MTKLGFRGGVRIINPLLVKCLLDYLFPNLGTLIKYLGPLDLMELHVPITGVWGTLLEVNFNLLHVHALVCVPPRTIATF